MYIKAAMLLMCQEVLGEGFFCFLKYRLKFKHGFTNRGCLHCAILKALHDFQEKRAHKSRDMQFFLQIVQNDIFKIFKTFKNNMKFTRAEYNTNMVKRS